MNVSLRSLNRCDYYVIIWCLYQMQGLLYPEGPIGQGLQALMLVWALFEAKNYILPNRKNPQLLKATFFLLFLYCVYGIVLMFDNQTGRANPHTYLQSYLASFLPVFLFYKYLKDGDLTVERLKNYIWLFLIVAIWRYFKYNQEAIEQLRKLGSKRDEITNNAGYDFLALIPISFFFYKKPFFQYSLLCVILLFIVMAMKRGPILIGGICFVWALLLNIRAAENRKQRYATICFGLAIILIGTAYVIYEINNSEYFNHRIESTEEGNMSRRDILYSGAIDLIFNDTSVVHLLIGRGAWATYKILGNFAHQDWLEIAVCCGLVGVLTLTYFCVSFFITSIKKVNFMPKQIHTAFIMLFFIFIFKSMFSMSLAYMPCYQSILIAFCIFYKSQKEYNYGSSHP